MCQKYKLYDSKISFAICRLNIHEQRCVPLVKTHNGTQAYTFTNYKFELYPRSLGSILTSHFACESTAELNNDFCHLAINMVDR